MSNAQDNSTLKWIRGELNASLEAARHALDDYFEGVGDTAGLIDECIQRLHQIHGTLQMVQLYGAALLAEEMELVAIAMRDGEVKRREDAAETLMLGLIQLPDYLEKLESGMRDAPILVLPMLNELRATRDMALLSEVAMFAPGLDERLATESVRGEPNSDMQAIARGLRHQYHKALLDWYREVDMKGALARLGDIFGQLASNAGTDQVSRLFRVSEAVAAALSEGSLEPGVATKLLLGKVDREIKRLISDGEMAVAESPSNDLLKNLLYYTACTESDNPLLSEVKSSFGLLDGLSAQVDVDEAREDLQAPSQALLESLRSAISADLVALKDGLDLYIRSQNDDPERLGSLEQEMRKIADTLGMVGQGGLRQRLKQQADGLAEIIAAGRIPQESDLMGVAGDILYIETSLENMATSRPLINKDQGMVDLPAGEFERLVDSVMHEARVDMAKSKELLVSYLSAPEVTEKLADVPKRFHSVAGAFRILHLDEPARILEQLREFVAQRLIAERYEPEDDELTAFADAITSLEYFMEAVSEGRGIQTDILEIARQSLGILGLSEDINDLPLSLVDESIDETPPEITESAQEPVAPEPEPEPVASQAKPALEEIDDEILEIFLEESQEELAVIQEYLPRWLANQDDREALTTFRRSFHTLKGSGRLVGAATIGEFSWSIENLLNRVIDETIEVSPGVMAILEETLEVLPELVKCQETGDIPTADTDGMMARAFALADPASNMDPVKASEAKDESPALESAESESAAAEGPDTEDAEGPAQDEALSSDSAEEIESAEAIEVDEAPVSVDAEEQPIVIDETLFSIFTNESTTHIATLHGFASGCTEDPLACRISESLTRALHTLHGSAHMAEVEPIAQVSKQLESYINDLREHERTVNAEVLSLINRSIDLFEAVLASINVEGKSPPAWRGLVEEISGSHATFSRQLEQTPASELEEDVPEITLEALPETIDALPDELAEETALDSVISLEPVSEPVEEAGFETDDLPQLEEVGLEQAVDQLQVSVEAPSDDETDSEIDAEFDLAETLNAESVDEDGVELEEIALTPLEDELPDIADNAPGDLQTFSVDTPDECDDVSAVEAVETVAAVDELPESLLDREDESLEQAGSTIIEDQLALADVAALDAHEESVSGREEASAELVDDLQDEAADNSEYGIEPVDAVQEVAEAIEQVARIEEDQGPEHEAVDASDAVATPPAASSALKEYFEVDGDPDLIEIFLEEARELIESAERAYGAWQESPAATDPVASLERTLHTLKGGARLSGAMPIGDLSHAFESLLTAVSHQRVEPTDAVLSLSQVVVDRLANQIDQLEHGTRVTLADDLIARLEAVLSGEVLEASTQAHDDSPPMAEDVTVESLDTAAQDASPEEASEADLAAEEEEAPVDSEQKEQPQSDNVVSLQETRQVLRQAPRGRREKVRVQSDLLDRLVNNAGEVSIYRARLEQQNGDLRFNISEFEQTVSRLHDQLRHMEIETEAQILFRYEKDKEEKQELDEAFDPLEFDRFSTMQQLSRSLIETVNDLENIKTELEEQQRETETLLLQQSRITTDLQDGLMRTRMVPFAQLVPRLNRLLRQTCAPLGKQAELKVHGAHGELDRSILDRMTGPFEHLLRNAVSHGIELPEARTAVGKEATGNIVINLEREGTDVLITIADDGSGIPIEKIRERAIERGLLDPNADVTDNDVLQFVLEHGFSTAQEVTQISGRGVGLDVVVSEVKQLGGSLDIKSEEGVGTQFIIRLPLTLAVSDALLVTLGDEIYAIPHASIEGVVRVSYAELKSCYDGEKEHYSYAGNDYQVRYLGSLLNASPLNLNELLKWYPMLLVRAGEHRVALHIDEVIGNRQIVVKSVGTQLSTVRWISGGTILGDGRVAIILDVTALVRLDVAHTVAAAPEAEEELGGEEQDVGFGKTVMVVDDSITVRKVTSRLLERHSMHVLTAKDGVDAVAMLQEHRPDIMLLDIEMPRMDGFELARHMRNSEELSHIPIIMITSRTGDKHRNLALDLGVKRYLGKPYQESDLLDNIHSVLTEVRQ